MAFPFRSMIASLALLAAAPAGARTVALAPHIKPPPSVEIRDRFHDAVVRALTHSSATDVVPAAEVRMRLGIDPALLECSNGHCIERVAALLDADRLVVTEIETLGKDYTIHVRAVDAHGETLGKIAEEHCDICTVREAADAVERAAGKVTAMLAPTAKPEARPEPKPPEPTHAAPPPTSASEEDEPGPTKAERPMPERVTPPPLVPVTPPETHATLPNQPGPAGPGVAQPDHPTEGGFPYRPVGAAVLAVGVGSIIATGVFGYYASKENGGDDRYTCNLPNPKTSCPEMYHGNTAPAAVFGVMSAVAVTTGAILLYVGRPHKPTTPTVGAAFLRNGFALSASLEF
jgi:hypothetical protein